MALSQTWELSTQKKNFNSPLTQWTSRIKECRKFFKSAFSLDLMFASVHTKWFLPNIFAWVRFFILKFQNKSPKVSNWWRALKFLKYTNRIQIWRELGLGPFFKIRGKVFFFQIFQSFYCANCENMDFLGWILNF